MLYLRKRSFDCAAVLVRLQNLLEYCFAPGAKLTNVFARRGSTPAGDGKTKDTAYHFPKARTSLEAIELSLRFLDEREYVVEHKDIGDIDDKHIYDLYRTNRGDVWFRVPTIGSQ